MLKTLLGIAPKLEADGSYSPSKLALKLELFKKLILKIYHTRNIKVRDLKYWSSLPSKRI